MIKSKTLPSNNIFKKDFSFFIQIRINTDCRINYGQKKDLDISLKNLNKQYVEFDLQNIIIKNIKSFVVL